MKERGVGPADTASVAKSGRRRSDSPLRLVWMRLPRRPAAYAGAVLTAAIAGIVLNAMALQPERLPVPFFATAKPAALSPLIAPLLQHEVAADASMGPQPPVRPQPLLSPVIVAAREPDRIGDLLRANSAKDSQRAVSATQAALVKLGYAVKITGVANPETLSALREFEKTRNLPASIDLTPRIAKIVLAAASEHGSR